MSLTSASSVVIEVVFDSPFDESAGQGCVVVIKGAYGKMNEIIHQTVSRKNRSSLSELLLN